MIASLAIKRLLAARFGEWNSNLLVAACYIMLVGIAALLLPAVNEVSVTRLSSNGGAWKISSSGCMFRDTRGLSS
jgi:hypothetical protein